MYTSCLLLTKYNYTGWFKSHDCMRGDTQSKQLGKWLFLGLSWFYSIPSGKFQDSTSIRPQLLPSNSFTMLLFYAIQSTTYKVM